MVGECWTWCDSYLPLSTNHRSSSVNGTWGPDGVTFFIIQGLASLGQEKMILFVILLLGYMIILGGNSMIIFVALTDSKLNSPMFFFLYNLSFVDIIYTTTTIPKMLSGLQADTNTISVPGCFLQMYFVIQLAVTGRAILTVMAYDRYVAICNPLRYNAIMTLPVRLLLIAGAWSFGAFCTLPATSMSFQRSYCGPNVVKHGWCDPSSVRRLVCGDVTVDNIVSLSCAVVALLTTGVLILTSYVLIGVSVSKMGVAQRLKAFGTCAAHLTVVSISYSSASCVYISYRVGNFPPEVRIIVSVLYSALTPFLNPMIYSLKNKELRESIMRTLSRETFFPGNMTGRHISMRIIQRTPPKKQPFKAEEVLNGQNGICIAPSGSEVPQLVK
ncbi:olfactory receptor 10J4-like [Cebidichthys violaceus]|uniref:olfactory receptor 10J4-like n=1 Tax=Cebidichthys violaceus TaxID=271503 RepID=UPI0035CB7B53